MQGHGGNRTHGDETTRGVQCPSSGSTSTTAYASDAIALPEVDTVEEANTVSIKLFVRNSGARKSQHRTATLGITSALD